MQAATTGGATPVTVGRIVRPQGNRGQVVVAPETDFGADRFVPGAEFDAVGPDGTTRRLVVTDSRPHDARWVVGFEGVASIDDAEALRNLELQVPEADLTPLEPGRYYVHDLVGCEVTSPGGTVGRVTGVDLATGTPVLEVAHERYGEVLVPLAEEICRRIDVAARRIEIAPPAGLVELNATRRAGGRTGEDRRRHHLPAHGRGRAGRGGSGPGA
ncbi:MAG: ribosome maturation factor RimM [Vicinamibacterales bacterium]